MDLRAQTLVAALGVALLACGGSKKDAKNPDGLAGSPGALVVPEVDKKLCDTTGKRVETYDLDRDNRPDVWRVFATVKERGVETEVMTCKQVDFDKDGVKDYVVTYRETGQMNSEEVDLTFDDRFDTRHHFDKSTNKVYLIERDMDHDGKPDVWEKFDDDGVLESVRRDSNGDGKPDIWEQYVEGELVAILYDDDHDNRVDRKEQIKLPKAPEADAPPPNTEDTQPPATEPKTGDSAAAPSGDDARK
jgi:hypothetical protein